MRSAAGVVSVPALALLLLVGCAAGGAHEGDPGAEGGASPEQAETGDGPPELDIEEVAESLLARPFADFVMSSGELVWVSGVTPGIVAYDAGMQPVHEVEAGEVRAALAYGHDAIWSIESGPGEPSTTLVRIDPATGEAARFPVAGPGIPDESSIAITDDAVWVIGQPDGGGPWTLRGHDPESGEEVRAIEAGDETLAAVRGGFGSLWVTKPDGVLDRYDPVSGELQAQIELSRSSTFLAIGPDAVWVMGELGEVARVDPQTDEVVATITATESGIRGGDIAASADAVWVQANAQLAVHIDPATNTVVELFGPPQGSGGVTIAGDGSVWITAHDVFQLYRIPPR